MTQKQKYYCTECDYGFVLPLQAPRLCPYCGSTKSVVEKNPNTTTELLKNY